MVLRSKSITKKKKKDIYLSPVYNFLMYLSQLEVETLSSNVVRHLRV